MGEDIGAVAHLLLASVVIALSGTEPSPGEADLVVECPDCARAQTLVKATTEPAPAPVPAADPQDITGYRCAGSTPSGREIRFTPSVASAG